jgi:hypothetical protein
MPNIDVSEIRFFLQSIPTLVLIPPDEFRWQNLRMVRWWLLLALLAAPVLAQTQVDYVGGTASELDAGTAGRVELTDSQYFAFYARKTQFRVPYSQVNLLEYGQQVDRRLAMAVVISPVFLLSKSRRHFLTVGYTDDQGQQQAVVFRVDKNSIRAALVALEARTGLKIQYQDQEARKAGK